MIHLSERQYPQFPIPGVGAIVVGPKGILLARRDKSPRQGLWAFPGGGVEVGETQQETIVREVEEETGVKCEVKEFVTTFDLIMKDSSGKVEFHFLLNYFLARALTESTKPEFDDGEVGWFHPDGLPSDMADQKLIDIIHVMRERILELMNV